MGLENFDLWMSLPSNGYIVTRCIDMDQAQSALQFERSVKKNASRLSLILLSLAVSIDAFLLVLSRWHTFDLPVKLTSMIFLFATTTCALSEILGEKAPERLKRFRLPDLGYVLILLAMIVFTGF
jgi:putative Mn2+ efflux pump MntP